MDWLNTLVEKFTDLLRWWAIIAPWERGLRVRCGKHVTEFGAGMHLRFPLLDRFYVQSIRLRTADVSPQTMTTLDSHTLTIAGVISYSINDLRQLYDTLHHPDDTIVDMASAHVAQYVSVRGRADIEPAGLQDYVDERMDLGGYGLNGGSFRVTEFAFVRTYRLMMANRTRNTYDPVSTDLYEG